MYYKIVLEKSIVGIASSADFRKYQEKHKRILFADEETGQFVECREKYYTDDWLRACPEVIEAEPADIVRIDVEEYENIRNQLDDGDIPEDESLDEEVEETTETNAQEQEETVKKTAAQILEERIRNLEKQIMPADQDADMIADNNIVSGQFFTSGSNLYKATANISRGAAIIVGKNAVRKPISEALNEINA